MDVPFQRGRKLRRFGCTRAPAGDVLSTPGYQLNLNLSFANEISVHSHRDITVFKGNISTQKGSWNLQPKDVSEVEPSQCFKNHQRTNFQALALVSKEIVAEAGGRLDVRSTDPTV